jgi:hypothetical protein
MSLGGDLQMLSSPQIESNSRGNQLGHAVLRSILGAGGGRPPLLSWRLPRSSGRVFPEEGTYGHDAAKAALRRYWEGLGFESSYGHCLVLDAMAEVLE